METISSMVDAMDRHDEMVQCEWSARNQKGNFSQCVTQHFDMSPSKSCPKSKGFSPDLKDVTTGAQRDDSTKPITQTNAATAFLSSSRDCEISQCDELVDSGAADDKSEDFFEIASNYSFTFPNADTMRTDIETHENAFCDVSQCEDDDFCILEYVG